MKKFISKKGVTSQSQSLSGGNPNSEQASRPVVGRRSFLKGLGATGALLVPASALLINQAKAQEDKDKNDDGGGALSKGDASILRFLAAAEILESDLWEQYWELGGVPFGESVETPRGESSPVFSGGNAAYITALQILDGDMPQYITDNTDDEFSHQAFIRAYLVSKGANTADIDLLAGPTFRTIPGSTATGSSGKKRLTNLTKLTIDTSYWGRYRSDNRNPDLGDAFSDTDRAVPTLNTGFHTAIPRTDADANNAELIKAIAFTAGFHFAFIEQGGTSLYAELAQRVTDLEVLRILLSIGPTETMHFQTWQDKAGNANTNPNGPPGNPPFTVTDSINGSTVTFVDLHFGQSELLQANLIMPEPTVFFKGFPKCSIIRPTQTNGAAMGAVKGLKADGLFTGQSEDFFELLNDLASDADAARRA
jgi:hypothetical protein